VAQPAPVVIRFFATVDATSIQKLLAAIDSKLKQGVDQFTLLISSPGGMVFHGLSAYNFLKGIPAEVTTHNFGSVDSIGVILYCAGTRRYTVPNSRFLLHGITTNFPPNMMLEEKQVEERLKSMQIDMWNISRVIASTTGAPVEDVNEAMLARTTLNTDEALSWGLAHEVRSELFAAGSEVIAIDQVTQPGQPIFRPPANPVQRQRR